MQQQRALPRKSRFKRRLTIVLSALALLTALVSGYVWYAWQNEFPGPAATTPKDGAVGIPGLNQQMSVLLIGADQRPGDTKYNTDSIILASVDPKNKRITLLSIPRDTKVTLAGYGSVKINSIAALKNLEALQQEVSDLTGVPVSGYILTNFSGFKDIIDTLGGITVNVEKDMYYKTGDKEDGIINLKKGVQRLDGTKALQYARFRHDELADISRTARQQVVLKAVGKEMMQASTIPKLPALIPELRKAAQTNLSLGDMLKLAKVAVNFDSSSIISQTLPGSFLDLDGVSYWAVDPAKAREVVKNLFQGKTTDEVIVNSAPVDLLKPVESTPAKPKPKVPGNSEDPNGPGSTGVEIPKLPNGGNADQTQDGGGMVVPGNDQDPNGEASTGYQEVKPPNS